MNLLTIMLIALSLAMDAFAVSISSGVSIKKQRFNHALRIALFFGAFQAIMPLIGWLTGLKLKDFISGFDHWVAFGLLFFIGLKMIYESTKLEVEKKDGPPSIYLLLLLSIATSIDALAIGFSFALLEVSIITPILIIGTITFILSFLGVLVGNKIGHLFESKMEFIGGLVIIFIGFKILIEHLAGYL